MSELFRLRKIVILAGIFLALLLGGFLGWQAMHFYHSSDRVTHVHNSFRGEGKLSQSSKLRSSGMETKQMQEGLASAPTRPPRQIRTLSEQSVVSEAGAVSAILGDEGGVVRNRVSKLQDIRGAEFSEEDRKRAMDFLSGASGHDDLGKSEGHWLADELLTNLRMQEPPREELAAELAEVAFRPNTDPVIRDYIMQHLGHLWEQFGARKEIEAALWQGVDSPDDTTPGTALIALSHGYERDDRPKSLSQVREKAMELAVSSNTPMASRVTALAIAGEAGDQETKELAEKLLKDENTPLMLRQVAGNVLGS